MVESVTVTENGVLPAVVGVPLVTPAGERVNPAGRAVPLARVKVYGATPPVAAKVVAYAVFNVAAGSEVVVRVKPPPPPPPEMVRVRLA